MEGGYQGEMAGLEPRLCLPIHLPSAHQLVPGTDPTTDNTATPLSQNERSYNFQGEKGLNI